LALETSGSRVNERGLRSEDMNWTTGTASPIVTTTASIIYPPWRLKVSAAILAMKKQHVYPGSDGMALSLLLEVPVSRITMQARRGSPIPAALPFSAT
jgi:hypothetical protein